jgi:hypothetical protein
MISCARSAVPFVYKSNRWLMEGCGNSLNGASAIIRHNRLVLSANEPDSFRDLETIHPGWSILAGRES